MKTKLLFFALLLLAASNIKAQFVACDPTFTFTVNPSGVATFTGTTTTSTAQYYWNFGNGTSGTGITASTLYNTVGSYTVCLTVVDSNVLGICTDTSCQTVTIGSTTGCQASFTAVPGTTANTYTMNNTSTGTALSYIWVWGDGTPDDNTMNPTHTYAGSGPYTVCLVAYNSTCVDSFCTTVGGGTSTVCDAMFSIIPDTGAGPGTYIGFNWSTGPALGLTYAWTWGDGTSSTGAYPSHTYATSGVYTICLTVSAPGCSDSMCVTQSLKTGGMVTINFQAPASVNSFNKNQAALYPNPADDKLYIKGNETNMYQIEIFNLNGSKVLSTSARGNQAINIANLPMNLYMVKVTDASGKSEFAKFMKQ